MIKGFKEANIYVEGLGIVKKNIYVENGKISKITDPFNDTNLMALANNKIIVPGFIDKHVHGANNSDGMYPSINDSRNISKSLAKEGVTSYLITTMTQTIENIDQALSTAKQFIENDEHIGAKAIGIHLEGPFICKKYKGAQVESCIIPCDVEQFKHFQKVSGNQIKQVTIAYEENGQELTKYLKEHNIVASIGHSDATSDQVLEAVTNGLTSATHTFNAMRPIHHREAGTAGGVLIADEVYCELIADLIHISPNVIKLMYKCKGKEKIVVVTDGIEAKQLPDGKYALGGQDVFVENQEARLIDGTLAGSTLRMDVGLKNLKRVLGLSIENIVDFATKNPAECLKIYDRKGSIKEGKDADFAIIDADFNVSMTISEGYIIYQ